nr:MAG: hypothetical protein 1 [Partitiviridae sp.]
MTSLRFQLAMWLAPELVKETEEVVKPVVEVKRSVAGALWSGLRRGLSEVAQASVSGFGVVKSVVDATPQPIKVGGLVLATAVATYYVSNNKNSLEAKYAKLREILRREAKVVMAVGSTSKILESRRAGSDETDMTPYKGQCQIGVYDGSRFVVHGAALRFAHNYLVGPDHVLGGSKLYARGKQGRVPLDGKDRIPLATDLVAIQLTEVEFSTIGVAEIRIGVSENPVYAQVVGPLGKGTTGKLSDDSTCFGRLVYEGTTLPGYSGSAYSSGPFCYGMHQCGGQVNGGFSASFIWCLLRMYLGRRDEDTADHLMNEFRKGRGIYWSTSHTDPSEVMVRINGKYEYHSIDTMYDVFGKDWMEKPELRKRGRDFQDFKDVQFESSLSGEVKGLKSGGSGILENPQGTPQLNLPSLIDAYNKLSTKSRKKFHTSVGLLTAGPTTSGPVKTVSQAK